MKSIFIQIAAVLFCVCANAQQAFTNKGNLQIHPGASISGFGNFTNTSTATLVNNGNFYLKANATNDQSSMTPGTGTLHLNGSTLQSLSGSQTFKTFNLVSNNASGITLNNNLSASGTHTFTAGMITTSATPNYMIYEAGASYSGNSDSRHINGWVKKIGNTNFVFPVGNAVYQRTIALTSLTAASEFNVKHNGGVTPNYNQVFNPVVYVDTAEYWTINKISGTAATVGLNWDNSKVPFPLLMMADIRAIYFDGSFWRSIGGATATGNATTTGSVSSNSVTAFNNNFGIGSISLVLPLKIIDFTAVRINEYTNINWVIGNELNVNHYELQRSEDGIHFYTISQQFAFNRYGTEYYNYADRMVLQGTAYYRLSVISNNGQVNYSGIVKVTANKTGKELYVVTNPVDAGIDIFADISCTGVYNYTISSNSGQLMQSGILDIKSAGIHTIKLQQVFSTGTYILVVKNASHVLQKIILKK